MNKEFKYYNNDKYIGETLKNWRHGYGNYVFKNGDKLNCLWEHDRVHGNVNFTTIEGAIYKCLWNKGEPVGNSKFLNTRSPNNISVYEIENKLRNLHKLKNNFEYKKNIQNIQDANNKNFELYLQKKIRYEKLYIGKYVNKLFKSLDNLSNKKYSFILFIFLMPLLLFLAITLPVFLLFWGGPIILFGLIKTAFTGVYLADDKKERNLIKANTYMILILVWTIISLFVFYNYPINYFL